MKILLISHGFPPDSFAGTEIYTYNLAKELLEIGHEVFVLYPCFSGMQGNYPIQLSVYKEIPVIKIKKYSFKKLFIQTYNDSDIDKIVEELIPYINPDLIHINHLLFLSFNIINILHEKKIPIVMTLHDYWFICPQVHLHKNYELCNSKNVNDCSECISKQGYSYDIRNIKYRDLFALDIISKIDIIISPSLFLRDKFSKYANINPSLIKHIPNGISTNNIIKTHELNQAFKQRKEKIVLGYFGNIFKAKGLHVLLEAFYKLDTDKYDLKIYGRLEESYSKSLDYNFPDWKQYYQGSYDNDEVLFLLKNIDVLVFPSIIFENYPTVILESLIAGVPVISTNIGGAKELINNNSYGLLFENMDAEDLKDKILSIDFKQLNIMKENLLSYQAYTFKEHVRDLDNIYQKLIPKQNFNSGIGKNVDANFFHLFFKADSFKFVSNLFIDTGSGFNEKELVQNICETSEDGKFLTLFNIPQSSYPKIESLRFDPLEGQFCVLKLNKIIVKYTNNEKTLTSDEIKKIITTNGMLNELGEIFFYTTDPQVVLPLSGEIMSISIEGELRILGLDEIIHEKEQIIHQKDQVIVAINSSWAMRIGKSITWLPRKVLNLARRIF